MSLTSLVGTLHLSDGYVLSFPLIGGQNTAHRNTDLHDDELRETAPEYQLAGISSFRAHKLAEFPKSLSVTAGSAKISVPFLSTS